LVSQINPQFYWGSGKRAEQTIKRASYKQARNEKGLKRVKPPSIM